MADTTGTPSSGTTDSAEGGDLLPGGGGGDSLEGSAVSDKLIADQSDGTSSAKAQFVHPVSATPPTASSTPMI